VAACKAKNRPLILDAIERAIAKFLPKIHIGRNSNMMSTTKAIRQLAQRVTRTKIPTTF
jgi:hypothetical protein